MIIGIFGDGTASPELVVAALNDTLEAHLVDNPDEEFWLCIGVHKSSPAIYVGIVDWALDNGTYMAFYTDMERPDLCRVLEISQVREFHRSERYMVDVVERLSAERKVKVYALLGAQEPSVAVRRALVRALDSGLEVRDLAEAGLTVVGVADNPIKTTGSTTMAKDEVSLEQAGELADEGDAENIQALTDLAAQFELDPDDYPTWSELATVLDPLLAESEVEEVAEEEAEAEEEGEEEAEVAPRRARGGDLTEEDLEGKSVPELRQLAKQLGVDGWDKNRSAKLIEGIMAAQGNGDAPAPRAAREEDDREASDNWLMAVLAKGLRAFADALES